MTSLQMAKHKTKAPLPAAGLPVSYLRNEFLRRKQKNPHYSLRAFAGFLGIPSGRLSEILAGKRRVSAKVSDKILDKIQMSHLDRARFLSSTGNPQELAPLRAEEFEVIANPSHFAVLTLMETASFKSDHAWVAKKLGLHVEVVRGIFSRLERLGLVERVGESWRLTHGGWTTTHDIPSAVLRSSHKAQLDQAKESLESVPVHLRDITSIYLAIDPKDLPAIKEKIKKFRREIAKFSKARPKKEVYSLQVQLFPLTK